MAVIETGKTVQPTTINKFLGLNLSDTGDTQIQQGESGNMTNFYITDDFKLRKMHGYRTFYQFTDRVTGMCSAKIRNNKYLFVSTAGPYGGTLHKFNEGDLTDAGVNPEKSNYFTSDGETLEYDLQHQTITSIESLKIGKSKITEFTISGSVYSFPSTTIGETTYPAGTINIASGKLTFEASPEDGTNIIIKYIKYLEPSTLICLKSAECRDIGDGATSEFSIGIENIETVKSLKIGSSTPITSFTKVSDTQITFSGGEINPSGTGTLTLDSVPAQNDDIILKVDKRTSLGSNEASFFEFDNCVYILCGGYFKYDGTELREVEGYIPKVFVNTPPAGGGILYDEINMLTGKKHQTFNPDGTDTYQLAQKGIASVDEVIVGGVVHTDYDYNLANGTVTFNTAPASTLGMDSVDIYWTKDDGDRDIIEGMRFGTVFGGDVDTRVFLYGNTDDEQQNRVYFSGIAYENDIAVPSVEYFPATAHTDIGPKNFAVTDLTRQYDRLLATTNKPEAYYLTISTEQLPVTLGDGSSTTRYVPAVSTFPLNEVHGNVAPGQGRVLDNNPVTFEDSQIIQWKSTNIRDERNMEVISQRIKLDLDKISMNTIKSLDLQEKNQLWVMCPTAGKTKVWIYNYSNKTFSRLELPDVMTDICSLDGEVYMATSEHGILKFSEVFATYGNNPTSLNTETEAKAIEEKIKIKAYWEMNFSDFGVPYLRKTMGKLWVSLQPQNWTTCEVSFISNRVVSTIKKEIEYTKQWFDNVNFADWHFTSSINPQPFRLKLKAKKFTNMKITIRNEDKSACTVLSLALQVESFGYSK